MFRRFQLNLLKYVIGVFVLVATPSLLFQNCSKDNSVNFNDSGIQIFSSIGGHNGSGYLGMTSNEYIRSFINFSCPAKTLSTSNIQGRVIATSTSITMVEDNCQDFSYIISQNDPRFDYVPYNFDFFGYNGVVYESAPSFNSQTGLAVETFCRASDSAEGLDIVAKINSNNETKVKIYLGEQSGGVWLNRVVSGFSVARNVSSVQASYQMSNFNLTVDLSRPTQLIFAGHLVAIIDGKSVNKNMSCRHMRRDSVLVNSNSGMLALWQMNNNLLDVSGFNNHITLTDPNSLLTYQSGHFDNSILLTGDVSTKLKVAPSSSLNNLSQLTVATWVWPTDNGSGLSNGGLVNKSLETSALTQGWSFYIGASTLRLSFEAGYSGSGLYVSSQASILAVSTWNHVVVTWDGSNLASGVTFYVNGVPKGHGAIADAIGTRIDDSTLALNLGDAADFPGLNLTGRLDQTSVWGRVLSAAEVSNLYNAGSTQP